MYAAFFGLRQPPFSIAPDPSCLFMSERHREALAHLLYGSESGGGFVLLTGEIGAGKTTVCRRFLDEIPEHARVAYIFNPKLSVGDLLDTICHEFGVAVHPQGPGPATIKEYLDPLNAHLLQCHAQGDHSVLIIDEAQSLSPDVLEQLRLLTNLETSERKLLQIILIGQPELRQMLARPEMEQLAQRVIARFHLGALSENETSQYVAHRMAIAGWKGGSAFSPAALRRVHRITGGVPRRINLLCDRALLGAYALSKAEVSAQVVDQAAHEVFEDQALGSGQATAWRRAKTWGGLALATMTGALLAWGGIGLWGQSWPPPAAPAVAVPAAQTFPPPASHSPTTAQDAAKASGPAALTLPVATSLTKDVSDLPVGPPPNDLWLKQENQGFEALGPFWGATLHAARACQEAQQQGLQCYRTPRMTLNGLRQLDRPALLQLAQPGQARGYVLVTAISGNDVELRAGDQRWRMSLDKLSSVWTGYYASLWRTPPGQKERLYNGFQGTAAVWMESRLNALQAQGQLPAALKTLQAKVAAFQQANGLESNGVASPTTLILLNRASGIDEPRLAKKPD